MTLQFVYDSVEQGNTVIRLTEGIQTLPAVAHGGEVSFAGVTIEDPNGTLDFKAWQPVYFEETACTGRTRIWTGFVASRSISRGRYRNGAGRIWDMTLVDQNAVFSLLPITGNTFNRPAETDIARLAFVTGSINLPSTLIGENGKANFTDNPVSFGEADYRHQFPLDMFTSVAGTSGKDFYAYYDHTAGETSLFYDLNAVTLSTSTLRISNVAADYDGTTTFAPLKDAVLTRSGEDVYSNIDYQYRGGFVVDADAQTASDFIQRGAIYSTDRVGRRETAVALAASFLDAHDEETDEIAFSVRLPKAKVNLIEQGMGLDVKFSHLPGYSADFVETKIISRNVRQYDDEWYDLDLVGSLKPLLAGPGGGDPGEFPHIPTTCDVGAATIVQSQYMDALERNDIGLTAWGATWDSTPTPGNLLYAAWYFRTAGPGVGTYTMPGWTLLDNDHVVGAGGTAADLFVFWKVADGTDSLTPYVEGGTWDTGHTDVKLQEWSGIGELDSTAKIVVEDTLSGQAGVSHTPTAGIDVVIISANIVAMAETGTPIAGSTEDDEAPIGVAASTGVGWLGHRIVEGTSGSYKVGSDRGTGVKHVSISAAFTCSSDSDTSPSPGQWVGINPKEEVDMSGSTGTTAYPFADGSLTVYVDDVDQTLAIVSQNGVTGAFTLGFIPTTTETVTVVYQARGG